ncbi:MAG: hypothetical protein WAW69_02900 [Polaromonas sp.]
MAVKVCRAVLECKAKMVYKAHKKYRFLRIFLMAAASPNGGAARCSGFLWCKPEPTRAKPLLGTLAPQEHAQWLVLT